VPTVSVIIPARDAAATRPATLAGLAAQRAEDGMEVIVVDDGSTDATATVAREAGATVIVGQGRGAGAARNVGVAAASGEILAFVDADVEPQPGWLEAGIRALDGADMVQGRVIPRPDRRLGPFDKRDDAEAAKSRLGDAGIESALVRVQR